MKPPIKRWSFSALRDFETCSYRIFLAKVEKAPQPVIEDPNHPLERGKRIHTEAEEFIKGENGLTRNLRKCESTLEQLHELYEQGLVDVEEKWGLDRQWRPVSWDNPECWGMVRLDAMVHGDRGLHVYDHKTGKSWNKDVAHIQQMQLYAIAAFMYFPDTTLVETSLLYLDEGKESSRVYTRSALADLLPRWQARAERLTSATAFPAKPNKGNCRFCPFGRANGTGACAYDVSEAI